MSHAETSKFFENLGKMFGQAGGDIGKTVDQANEEFRRKGMNGTPEEREDFLQRCFYAARFNMRVVLLAAPYLRQNPEYDKATNRILEAAAQQARETGFDEEQTRLYVDAHRRAYESLAEEFGIG